MTLTPIPLGVELRIKTYGLSYSESAPDIASLADGSYVATWTSIGAWEGSSRGIYGQRFAPDGTPIGNEFYLDTPTASWAAMPSVTSLGSGGFVVTWSSSSSLPNGSTEYHIRTQIFDHLGEPVASDFLVNVSTASGKTDPTVTALSDDRLLVTWTSSNQDDDFSHGIYGRIFTATGKRKQASSVSIERLPAINLTHILQRSPMAGSSRPGHLGCRTEVPMAFMQEDSIWPVIR